MSSKGEKDFDTTTYTSLLDENHALKAEVQKLRARLEESEELKRAISEGDLDALVFPGPKGSLTFTLDSADHAYRTLVETMNEGTATLGFDGTILYCNKRFAELIGMPLQTIVGTSIHRLIAPNHEITFKAILEQRKGSGEINFLVDGGTSLPAYLYISSLPIEESQNAWCLVATDLTEQKKNEEKIQNLANIVESSCDAILILSLDGIITTWNKGAEQIYGYLAEEIVGKSVSMLAPDDLKSETKMLIEKVKLGEKIQHYVTSRLRKDDKLIYVSMTLSPVFDASKKRVAISAVTRDITQKINAEKS